MLSGFATVNETQNPYQSPESPLDDAGKDTEPRWCLPLGEFVIVAAIMGGLVGLLVTAVEAARYSSDVPPLLPQSLSWINDHPMSFVLLMVVGCALAIVVSFWGLRSVAPAWLRSHSPW
jgi:hypothetical protein